MNMAVTSLNPLVLEHHPLHRWYWLETPLMNLQCVIYFDGFEVGLQCFQVIEVGYDIMICEHSPVAYVYKITLY